MDSLGTLSNEAIKLLNSNELLGLLIKREFIKHTLKNVHIEKEEEEKLINKFLEGYGVKDPENIEKWMNDNNLNSEDLSNLALSDVRLKKYCEENFTHQINARFLERKSQLDKAVYTLIRVDDKLQAEEIYLQALEKEADIGDLATKYSLGLEKNRRGILGPQALNKVHPLLAEALRNGEVGVVQPPFEIEKSYIVCRVECFEPAQLDEVMHEKMAIEIFDQWVDTNTKEIAKELINKSLNKTAKELI